MSPSPSGNGPSSPGFLGRARTTRLDTLTRKDSAATSSRRYARQFLGRLDNDVDSVTASPLPSPLNNARPRAVHAPRWPPEPRCTVACACCTRASAPPSHPSAASRSRRTARKTYWTIASARGRHPVPVVAPIHKKADRTWAQQLEILQQQDQPGHGRLRPSQCHRRCHRSDADAWWLVVDRLVTPAGDDEGDFNSR